MATPKDDKPKGDTPQVTPNKPKDTGKEVVGSSSSTPEFYIGSVGIDVGTLTANVNRIKEKGFFEHNTNRMYDKAAQALIHKGLRDGLHASHPDLGLNDDNVWPTFFTQLLCRVAIRQTSSKTQYNESIVYYGGADFSIPRSIPDKDIRNLIVQSATGLGDHPNPERKFFRGYSGLWLKIVQADGGKNLENTSLAAKWGLPQNYRSLTPDFMEATNDLSDEFAEALRLKTREAVSSAPATANAPLLNTALLSRQFTAGHR